MVPPCLLLSIMLMCACGLSLLWFIGFGHLLGWCNLSLGSNLGFLLLSKVLVEDVVLWTPGFLLPWILRSAFLVVLILMCIFLLLMSSSLLILFVGVFVDRVLSSLVLPAWFRHAYFQDHAGVRLRFKLAAGLGESWTRDGGIPQGCPLSMMFIVALYLPWCRYLDQLPDVSPQLYADNLKCASSGPEQLLRAAQFTSVYVRLVGQEPASCKCILMSTSAAVRRDMKDWVIFAQGETLDC